MNEFYAEIRENLRQQHAANEQEISVKKVDNFNKYRYYEDNGQIEQTGLTGFSIFFKSAVFFISVMLFSFYIYGGEDVKKGATMVWNDMKQQIIQLEQEEPIVKETMSYIRKAYSEVEAFRNQNE